MDSLERENLVLKEQSLKLQEQITLLEKRLASQQEEWKKGQETTTALRKELKQIQGKGHCHGQLVRKDAT
jgi:predicted  nucleic acid-binding Zn-ribbon protein